MRKITKKKLFYLGMSTIAVVAVSSVFTMGVYARNPQNNVNKKFDTLGERTDGIDSTLQDGVSTNDKNLSNRDNNLPKLETPGSNKDDDKQQKTTIKFLLNDSTKTQIGDTIELNDSDFESFNLILSVPEGYELLNKNTELEKNSENLVFIKEVVKDLTYKTTLIFKFENKVIKTETVTTVNDEKINISRYIPEGYKLENESFEVIINQNNEINLIKIIDKPESPTEEVSDEVTSTLKYFYEVNLIKQIEVKTKKDATISAGEYLPSGYELVDKNVKVNLGEINLIQITPIPVEPTNPPTPENPEDENEIFDDTLIKDEKVITKLIYKDNKTNSKVFEIEVQTKKGEFIYPVSYLPEGYDLVDSTQLIYPGQDNEILVAKKEVEQPKTLDTTIIFRYNNKNIETKVFKLLENSNLTIKDINYVPVNYHLVDQSIKVNIGAENIINIEPNEVEVRMVTTTLIYVSDNVEILKKAIEKPEGETIDYKEFLPEGYEFVKQNYEISYGKENRIGIQPKKKLVSTTLVYKEGDEVISEKTISTNDDEIISASNYLPNNYILVNPNASITSGQRNEIAIKKVEEIHETVSTKLVFILNSKEVGTKTISSLDNAKIDVRPHIPLGYELKNPEQVINVGQTNKIEIVKSQIRPAPPRMGFIYINWILEDGTILEPFSRLESVDDEIPVIRYMPSGYEAFDQNEARKVVVANTDRNTAIVKIKKKSEVIILPEPTLPVEPEVPTTPEEPTVQPEPSKPTPTPEPTPNQPDRPSIDNSLISNKTNIAGKPINPEDVNIPDHKNPDWEKYKDMNAEKITEDSLKGTKEFIDTLFTAIGKDGFNDEKAFRDALKKQGIGEFNTNLWVDYIKNYREKWQEPGRDFLLHFRLWLENVKREINSYAAKGMAPDLSFLNRISMNYSGGKQVWYVEGGGSWTYPNPLDSPVIKKIVDQNSTKRVMNYDTWYSRDPESIQKGNFPGWEKRDVSSSYSTSLSGSSKVYSYTKNGKTLNILDVDVKDAQSYANFKSDIQKLQGKLSGGINGIVIRNIGGFGAPSDLKDVFKSLPSTVQKLTLFFEGKDTSSLIALKDKHIKEIELYTNQNGLLGLDKDWAINPNALKGVDFVPYDYNNDIDPRKVSPDALKTTSITFQVLKFDNVDNITTINQGLKIAFQDKYDLRVFQGYWGEGSWITHLDFSNVRNIRTLKDMNLYGKVFYDLTLWNENNVFEIKSSDLARSQFSALIVKHPSDYGKFHFITPDNRNVDTLYISGNASSLEQGWGTQLAAAISAGRNIFKKIVVDDPNMVSLVSSFNTYGWNISVK
ncbi:putative immunoglobulin-blocking virulence protein [Mycoplasmopsis anatis]|uniref:putative immunoglobulin-blocking virulence protein n=1 Tax=Mycoplasmopsis anatis TaxID=171279 RepID=UPI001C4E1DEF|nr:putative immunoglobulin-blocking virulence protein [Mycoplasmopsis anatis]MBW0594971.1 putative immunoglobulin-blocking virulence protein [Mycoplasmopsis anatis]MBW0595710.1 putative immunoglobulin-blocking virulence protein [Mycoplasmopsis anatis]MBW0598583.1 putative immunoglobulin-blocking virulence protein [Mycoplasmopsis anatis]MBW0599347.1 putative immunoglobulin-blocking virulence protein [Mycoplasmopsis anatis]MBW0601540.1 putative immunoglobulin-blocking virulence protein [Mycoplas